ncbi:RidA family protein (plasmid) [Sinorhizobium sp. K101]|jgi:reactive intermediate/imine deaminase|uniref:RidA family protein n=1 Tax=unclassified Sinorhizobium TaxID=2613772 RepID=UPI0023D8C745|nr:MULTISPECIES: RidA family protein [unclassified Sinorhizobium]WEJ11787.1 RidA family protein [Sinorhizobium sp. M103]WEJ17652.1 RidA family protein [Sinorhizobium sp. K101]
MFLEQVVTKPDPYAPFLLSQAIKANGFVFVSGQAAIGDNGEIVGEGDFDRQAEQAFGNLDRALKAAGSGLDKVVKVTIFLRSMENFAKIVELRRRWFSAPYPADSIIEVSSLYSPKALIEIEAIALDRSR